MELSGSWLMGKGWVSALLFLGVLSFIPIPGEETAKRVAHQISSALQYLHDQGITHRDMKPSVRNIETSYVAEISDRCFRMS